MPARKPDTYDTWLFPLDAVDLRQRSINGAIVTVASQLFRTLLTGISLIWLARLLTASDFGLMAIVAPVLGFLALLSNIGLFQAVVQNPKISDAQITSMFWISFCLGLIVGVLFLMCAPFIAWIYHDKKIIQIMTALSPIIVLASLCSIQLAVLNRLMAFVKIAIIETSALLVATMVSVGFAWAGWGYWALVMGQVANAGVTASLAWGLSPWAPGRFLISVGKTTNMLAFGRNLTAFNIAVYLNTSLDNMIVGLVLGIDALGLYDRAWKLAVLPLTQLISPINRIAIPALSRLVDDQERYRKHFGSMLQMLFMLSSPGLIAAILSAPVTVSGLLGSRWQHMAPVFQWLCIGGIVSPINGAAFWLMISQGRSRDQLYFSLMAISINICSYGIGIFWGLEGVVRTGALSVYLFQAPILLFGACRIGPVRLGAFIKLLVTPSVCTIFAALVSCIFWVFFLPASYVGVIGLFAISYALYMLAVLARADGREILYGIWQQYYQTSLSRALALRPRA